MSIQFNETDKIFHLQTKNTSYVFCIAEFAALEHLYYGKKIPLPPLRRMLPLERRSKSGTRRS